MIAVGQLPLFLVGAERSGTTVLRLMLDHHPRIAWLQEFEYAVDYVGNNGRWPDVRQYSEWLSTHRIFRARGFEVDPELDYPDLVRSFLLQHQRCARKPIIGATVHRHFDRLLHIWPDARFIHIVRDPRDVARSNVAMGWAGNVYTGVNRWLEAERLWEGMRGGLPPERFMEVMQENLIREPEQWLDQICCFIGVDYESRMLAYPQDTTYDPPDPNLIGQWRRKASEHEIRLVEMRVGELLSRRGYEPSGLPPLQIGIVEWVQLRIHDRLARIHFRRRRYGWSLWAADILSRRLPLKAWRRDVRLRRNEVDTLHLK
jgi:hypothetical protein